MGRLGRALSAGQKRDARNRRGDVALQRAQRRLRHLLGADFLALFLPAITMFGLSTMPSSTMRAANR